MKKNITRMVLLVISAAVTMSLVLGLAGCAPTGSNGYAQAEKLWKEASTKTAVDDITITGVVDLGNTLGKAVNLSVNLELTRKYKANGKVDQVSGKIKTIAVSGMDKILNNGTIMGIVGGMLPPEVNLNEIIVGGTLTLENPASGTIKLEGGNYKVTAVDVDILGLIDITLDDIMADNEEFDGTLASEEDVNNALSDLNLVIPFDLLTMYAGFDSTITKDNKASFKGETGLNFLLVQAYALIDTFFDGELEFDGELVAVPELAEDIVEDLCGGTSSDDIKNYLIGTNGLINLGDVELEITYEGKKFNTISGTHTMGMSIPKADINKLLSHIDTGDIPVSLVVALLPNTITGSLTVEFTTTYTY